MLLQIFADGVFVAFFVFFSSFFGGEGEQKERKCDVDGLMFGICARGTV